jgi:hypothetical protein
MLFSFPEEGVTIEIRHSKVAKHVQCSIQKDGKSETKQWVIDDRNWNESNPFRQYMVKHKLGKIIEKLDARKTTAFDLVGQVTQVVDYPAYEHVDIFFGDTSFRMEKKNFIDPEHFYIWYMARFHKLLDISKEDWQSFVALMLDRAEKQSIDPLAPPLVENLINLLKHSQIHSRFCKDIEMALEHGGEMTFFVQDETNKELFYVSRQTIRAIAKREKISQKGVRKYLQPILFAPNQIVRWAGKQETGYWILDFRKMFVIDRSLDSIMERVIDCKKEAEVEEK